MYVLPLNCLELFSDESLFTKTNQIKSNETYANLLKLKCIFCRTGFGEASLLKIPPKLQYVIDSDEWFDFSTI